MYVAKRLSVESWPFEVCGKILAGLKNFEALSATTLKRVFSGASRSKLHTAARTSRRQTLSFRSLLDFLFSQKEIIHLEKSDKGEKMPKMKL